MYSCIFYAIGTGEKEGKKDDIKDNTTKKQLLAIHIDTQKLIQKVLSSYLHRFLRISILSSLPSPIRTLPSALELPQILSLCTERLAGFTADQELEMQQSALP